MLTEEGGSELKCGRIVGWLSNTEVGVRVEKNRKGDPIKENSCGSWFKVCSV